MPRGRRSALWVAESGNTVAGFLLGEAIGMDFHIRELAVAGEAQRQGIGRCLLEAALAEARRRGFARATLTTDRTLPWNGPWYRRCGFHEPKTLSVRLTTQLASEIRPERRCALVCELTRAGAPGTDNGPITRE